VKERKGRMINKDISNSKRFASLSSEAAVLFTMLIPHYNSHGKMNGGPGYIKDEICPFVEYLNSDTIPILLLEISDKTNVKWFESDGRYWIHSIKFLSDHQDLDPKRLGKDNLPDFSETSQRIVIPEVEVKEKIKEKGKKKIAATVDRQSHTEIIKYFHDTVQTEKKFKPNIDGGDGRAVHEMLKKYSLDQIKDMIIFYLHSDKAHENGITLKAIFSTHSVNVYLASKSGGSNGQRTGNHPAGPSGSGIKTSGSQNPRHDGSGGGFAGSPGSSPGKYDQLKPGDVIIENGVERVVT